MKSMLPVIFVGLGVFLIGLGFVWSLLFPASRTWTDEKALRMTELSNEAHKLLFLASRAKTNPTPDGPTPQEAQAKYDAAQAELDALREEFEGIRDSPKNSGTYMQWAGAACALIGGMGVMSGRGG